MFKVRQDGFTFAIISSCLKSSSVDCCWAHEGKFGEKTWVSVRVSPLPSGWSYPSKHNDSIRPLLMTLIISIITTWLQHHAQAWSLRVPLTRFFDLHVTVLHINVDAVCGFPPFEHVWKSPRHSWIRCIIAAGMNTCAVQGTGSCVSGPVIACAHTHTLLLRWPVGGRENQTQMLKESKWKDAAPPFLVLRSGDDLKFLLSYLQDQHFFESVQKFKGHFTQDHKCQPSGGAKRGVKGSLKPSAFMLCGYMCTRFIGKSGGKNKMSP